MLINQFFRKYKPTINEKIELENKTLTSIGLEYFLKDKKNIFDIGVGPNGSEWWKHIDTGSKIIGIDVNYFPCPIKNNIEIFKYSDRYPLN